MRVRLRVNPDDIDDFEFDNFAGIVMILESLRKGLTNTDWLAEAMTQAESDEVMSNLTSVLKILTPLVEPEPKLAPPR